MMSLYWIVLFLPIVLEGDFGKGIQLTAKDRLHRLNSRTASIAPHQNLYKVQC